MEKKYHIVIHKGDLQILSNDQDNSYSIKYKDQIVDIPYEELPFIVSVLAAKVSEHFSDIELALISKLNNECN